MHILLLLFHVFVHSFHFSTLNKTTACRSRTLHRHGTTTKHECIRQERSKFSCHLNHCAKCFTTKPRLCTLCGRYNELIRHAGRWLWPIKDYESTFVVYVTVWETCKLHRLHNFTPFAPCFHATYTQQKLSK